MQLGYTMLCEQTAPKQLVSDLVRAEEIGFDFSITSDHCCPWLEEQGHSPYAWSVLGAERQDEFFEFAEAELLPALRGQ